MQKREYDFYVYILASRSHQIYVGMTNSLERRMKEHFAGDGGTFTARYNINRLVYFEHMQYVLNAIARESELKNWPRKRKLALIESVNPTWQDLSEDWGEGLRVFQRLNQREGTSGGTAMASATAKATADSGALLRNDNKGDDKGDDRANDEADEKGG